jgi:hypothetical protein
MLLGVMSTVNGLLPKPQPLIKINKGQTHIVSN